MKKLSILLISLLLLPAAVGCARAQTSAPASPLNSISEIESEQDKTEEKEEREEKPKPQGPVKKFNRRRRRIKKPAIGRKPQKPFPIQPGPITPPKPVL